VIKLGSMVRHHDSRFVGEVKMAIDDWHTGECLVVFVEYPDGHVADFHPDALVVIPDGADA
jgi:hypothetical protein